jgi:hypothetical protein
VTNSIDVPEDGLRVELDDGQIVETDGTTVVDPASGDQVPAVVLRMTRSRAHVLAHVLEDWSRVAFVFANLRSSASPSGRWRVRSTPGRRWLVTLAPAVVRCASRRQ